ncbi:MAG: cyclic nucleotide-binding domain-containing protein [Proteobacteria bacterium]|nr:cyclic nucleotide-binding domain-containing protein [Pseudomonadota bacterium]MBU1709225.1 cyclic nucleotide-binding domain-containing protein [Pseudomonadota bacterium]
MRTYNNNHGDNIKILELLRQIKRFDIFSDNDLNSFLKLSNLLTYKPNEVIIKEGEYDCWVYFLIKGSLDIIKDGKVIGKLQRNGDLFGEMGVIEGSPRSASIRANAESVVLGVDASVIDRKFKTNEIFFCYTIYRLFSEVLAARLRNTTEENTVLRQELRALKEKYQVAEVNPAAENPD